MTAQSFSTVNTTEVELRALMGEPSELSRRKQQSALDVHCRAFIGLAPFLLVGTVGIDSLCDVSPRGDAPGFVQVLDEQTLVIPERPGNRRIDTYCNLIQNPRVGLLFLVPGQQETLRV